MSMYDANIGPETLSAHGHEVMEQTTIPQELAPVLVVVPEGDTFQKDSQPAVEQTAGPGSETYLAHAKYGGKAAAEEVFALQQDQAEIEGADEDSAGQSLGFMSKLSDFVGEHPGLTFGVALGSVGTFGAVAAETASGTPVDAGMNSSAKIGTLKAGASDTEASASTVNPCEDSVESDCSYDPPAGSETPPPPENPGNGKGNGDKHPGGKDKGRDDNLLPLPKHKTVRYYATQLINENRKGDKGRINLSNSAKHDLNLARAGKCAPIDMIPGACVKIKKTLLETLYKASLKMRYKVNYITGADHVTCSDHYQGRGADLMKYNGGAPHNRKLLHVFAGVLKRLPGHKTAQLLGPGDAGHSGSSAHWHIGITGSNGICE